MIENLQLFLARELMGNTYLSYCYAVFFFAAALTALYFVREVLVKKLKDLASRTETDLDDLVLDLVGKIRWPEYQLVAFYAATRHLHKAAAFDRALFAVILVVFTYRSVTLLQHLVSYWITRAVSGRDLTAEARASVVVSAQVIMRTVIWVAAVLFILANMGVNISAVLTGLGIGGVAVALAAQAILGDLFNFFVILLDKPFAIGDFVTSDAVSGTIEHIGLKSTRIRSLSGELVVVSNTNLLNSRIRNYQDQARRRVVFKTGVVYGTPPAKLRKVPELVKKAVLAAGGTEFDRCSLYNCGDYSLDYETVYNMNTGDYGAYMATHERVLLAVLDGLAAEGVELAYPTQTLLVRK